MKGLENVSEFPCAKEISYTMLQFNNNNNFKYNIIINVYKWSNKWKGIRKESQGSYHRSLKCAMNNEYNKQIMNNE